MRKTSVGLVFLVLGCLASYFYFLAPSSAERDGARLYETKDYPGATLQYTRALASKPSRYQAERLLFKLGNSARQLGQRERATDFYFKILRDNPDSTYRKSIQGFLRVESQDLHEQNLAKPYQLDLDTLRQTKGKGLLELKRQKDRLYSYLVKNLSLMQGDLSHEVKTLYRDFKAVEREFNSSLQTADSVRQRKTGENLQRRLALVGFPENVSEDLRKHESVFQLNILEVTSIMDLFARGGEQIPQSVFIRLQGVKHTNFTLNLGRLLDFSEKTKIFLLIDDNKGEGTGLPEPLDEEIRILRCPARENCRGEIQKVIHSRHLWQSNGSTI